MPFDLGPAELGLILLIVAMLFGVGRLPEVFGSLGKGIREFRKEAGMDDHSNPQPQVLASQTQVAPQPAAPPAQAPTPQAPVAN